MTSHTDMVYELNRAFLGAIISASLEPRNLESLLDIGVDAELIQVIKDLRFSELAALSKSRALLFNVSVDKANIPSLIRRIKISVQHNARIDAMIVMGASMAMMISLFSMTRASYEARHEFLKLTPFGPGRPSLLSVNESLRVADLWNSYQQLDIAERYFQIGKTTGIPLRQLWAHMQESSPPSRSSRKTGSENQRLLNV